MNRVISEKTLVPLSLVLLIGGGIFWLSSMWALANTNAKTIVAIKVKHEERSANINTSLSAIRTDIGKIEGYLKAMSEGRRKK